VTPRFAGTVNVGGGIKKGIKTRARNLRGKIPQGKGGKLGRGK